MPAMKQPTDESASPAPTLATRPSTLDTVGAEFTLPSADQVRAGLARLHATAEQTETVLWFLQYGIESRGAKNRTDLANLIGSSATSVSKVFNGNYDGSLETFVGKIRSFRFGAGVHQSTEPFARLRIAEEIIAFCEATRNVRQMSLLWGPNQSAKSRTLKTYAAAPRPADAGRTFYTMMPAGGATRPFGVALATSCGFSNTVGYQQICDTARGFFRPGDLLIIDEYHQCMIKALRTVTIELIKEIFETCGCAILLCGTDVMPQKMQDPRFRDFLGQTWNRGALRKRVPIEPYKADIAAAFAAYGFPALTGGKARDLAEQTGRRDGLGHIFRQLQLAAAMARKRKEELTLQHYITTVHTMLKWSEGTKADDQWESEAAA